MIPMNWQKFFKKTHISLLFVLMSCYSYSQNLIELQNKYPNYSEVALETTNHYTITLNKNQEIEVTSKAIEDYLILKSATSGIDVNESLVYSDLVQITKYDAYTIGNDTEKNKITAVKNIKDKPLNTSNVFDSDTKLKIFTFSNLDLGARKVLKHNLLFKDPMLLHRFNFASNMPSVERKIIITVDKSIEIGYKIFNDNENLIQQKIEETKRFKTYTFIINNAPIYKYDSYLAGRFYEMPHIHFWIHSYIKKGEKQIVFGEIDGLYKYYNNFIKNINATEDEKLKEFTLNLVKDSKSNDEKMQEIFKYVQNQIKYIAFESGYEGFIPREASLVYERKFGDCKDMASIITEMAKYANVPNVNLTWIGTRELPYTYEELPTPAVDNHMIASYENNGKIIFLDATDSEVPFGLPSEFIQEKEALIARGDQFKLVKIEAVSSETNKYSDEYIYELKGEKIEGKGNLKTYGLTRSSILNNLGDASKNRKKYIVNILKRGNDKLNVLSFTEKNLEDNRLPYEIAYHFENENYVIGTGDETYLNMYLHKPFIHLMLDEDRKTTADIDRLQKFEYKSTFKIPEKTTITYLPENIFFENAFLKYAINLEKSENEIFLNYTIENKKTFIKPSEVKEWNESLRSLKNNLSETIVIKKI